MLLLSTDPCPLCGAVDGRCALGPVLRNSDALGYFYGSFSDDEPLPAEVSSFWLAVATHACATASHAAADGAVVGRIGALSFSPMALAQAVQIHGLRPRCLPFVIKCLVADGKLRQGVAPGNRAAPPSAALPVAALGYLWRKVVSQPVSWALNTLLARGDDEGATVEAEVPVADDNFPVLVPSRVAAAVAAVSTAVAHLPVPRVYTLASSATVMRSCATPVSVRDVVALCKDFVPVATAESSSPLTTSPCELGVLIRELLSRGVAFEVDMGGDLPSALLFCESEPSLLVRDTATACLRLRLACAALATTISSLNTQVCLLSFWALSLYDECMVCLGSLRVVSLRVRVSVSE